MKQFRKTQIIELVKTLPNGDVEVQNQGQPEDRWVIPADVFASTYEEINHDKKGDE